MDLLLTVTADQDLLAKALRLLGGLCQLYAIACDHEMKQATVRYEDQSFDVTVMVFTIHDYDCTPDDFNEKLTQGLGRILLANNDVTISRSGIRTAGFGEDGPRWSTNDRGVTEDHRPWERS